MNKININEITTSLWPLIATTRYIWYLLLIVFVIMLGLSIPKWVLYSRKKEAAEYKQSKKSIIKFSVINLIVIPVIIFIILGIITLIITNKFIPQLIDNWKETGALDANGNWKDVMAYTGQNNSGGIGLPGLTFIVPVKVGKSGVLENFEQIQSYFSGYIGVA